MATDDASAIARPAPVPDEASRPFFDAAAAGRLLIKHCSACSRHLAPQAEFCDRCLSGAIDWRDASGLGAVYSFIINHQAQPGFSTPYNIIIVELEEGPRLTGNYLGPNDDLTVGMAVKVAFERAGDVMVPKWVRA